MGYSQAVATGAMMSGARGRRSEDELASLRERLEEASKARARLRAVESGSHSRALADEIAALERSIAELWEQLRERRVRRLHGPAEPILQRAGREARLERELDRQLRRAREA